MPREPLTNEYLEACRLRAMRFVAQWDAGTSGSLAADVRRLLWEVERLKVELAYRENRRLPALEPTPD